MSNSGLMLAWRIGLLFEYANVLVDERGGEIPAGLLLVCLSSACVAAQLFSQARVFFNVWLKSQLSMRFFLLHIPSCFLLLSIV